MLFRSVCWSPASLTVPAEFSFSGGPFPFGAPNRYVLSIRSSIQDPVPRPEELQNCSGYRFTRAPARLEDQRVGKNGVVYDGAIGGSSFLALVRLPRQRRGNLSFPLDRIQAGKGFSFSLHGSSNEAGDAEHGEGTIRVTFTPSH